MHEGHLKIIEDRIRLKASQAITIDHWNNQPSNTAEENVITPAVYIDFGNVQWSKLANGVKQGRAKITVYCVSTTYRATNDGAYDGDNKRLFQRFEWCNKVLAALDGFQGKDNDGLIAFQGLNLIDSMMDTAADAMKTDAISFDTMLYYYDVWREKNWQCITLESVETQYDKTIP